ncbi:transposable element Tcb2 transposase [Trichonephila clavipes]|nr:transposable element Tcb2 transposase [Trichonephila clavipes]
MLHRTDGRWRTRQEAFESKHPATIARTVQDGGASITDGIYQQDSTKCHTAGSGFKEHQMEFTVLFWLANSPDLNPIKNLWDHLDRVVHAMDLQPRNLEHWSSRFVDTRQWGLAMSERSCLPDSKKWRVVGWMEIGLSQADAASHLNVSCSVVHRLWNQYQTVAFVCRRHVPARPRATTPTGDRFITLSARRRRRISVLQLVADHSVESGRRIST